MPPDTESSAAPSTSPASSWIGSQIGRLAGRLADPTFPTGDHAALRRMNPRDPGRATLALYRLLLDAKIDPPQSETERWALIVHCLALARGGHDYKIRTGEALHQLHFSEARLNQLLAADTDVLFDVLPLLARRAGAQGISLDWVPLAEMARWAGRNEEKADKERLKIARSFAQAQANTP